MKVRWGPVFLAAIIALVLLFSIPFLPWLKPEITEGAKIITSSDGRCVVETESTRIINVGNCNLDVGQEVTVKYRESTSAGELVP